MVFLLWKTVSHFTNKLSPIGATVDEKQLHHDLSLLNKSEINEKRIRFLVNGRDPDSTVKDIGGKINQDDRIIELIITNKNADDYSKPLEVRTAIRSWLYLQDRHLPYSVVGMKIIYLREPIMGIFGGTSSVVVLVTKSDFEGLFKKLEGKEIDEEQKVDELTQLWISEHNYKRKDGNW